MPSKYLIQRFIGGMNSDIDPAAIDLTNQNDQVVTIVASATNGIFERGLLRTRPQITLPINATPIPTTNNILAISALPFPSNVSAATFPKGLLVLTFETGGGVYKLWWLSTQNVTSFFYEPTEITGPGITASGWDNFFFSNTVCNGVVLIAGYKGGLIRWDPTTNVYTIISTAKFAYVATQNSRAVAAYKTTGAVTDPMTMAASAPGDETDWTSIQSYTNIIADIPDAITGLGVAKGILVLPRTFGFHLAYPTGTFPAIYNIAQHSADSIGSANPATLCIYKNVCYFVSVNGIHTFDLVDTEEIGEGIHLELLTLATQLGGVLRAFISSSYKNDFQPTYNVYLDLATHDMSPGTIPLFSYNIKERKWNRWFSGSTTSANSDTNLWYPFYFRTVTAGGTTIPLISAIGKVQRVPGASPVFGYTVDSSGGKPESAVLSFTTGQLTISSPTLEAMISRIMLVYKATTSTAISATVSIDSTLNGVTTNITQTVALTGTSSVGPPSIWIRQWVGNLRSVGHMFQITISMTSGTNYSLLKEMIVEFTDEAEERL